MMWRKTCRNFLSFAAMVLSILLCPKASMFNRQPQFTIEAVKNKAFNNSCRIGRYYQIKAGNIAECLEHCLENCACQSFQVCHKTNCKLCSSNKEDDSSLLHDKDDCIYAMYKMPYLPGVLKTTAMDDQCSDMSCSLKYTNCCQQSGLCPKNKICKPANFSHKQPWKRFTCECPVGLYRGDDCKPITSCQGHYNGSQGWGMYKVLDSRGAMYEVYCHFDPNGAAWTLAQSYSFANRTLIEFRKPLYRNRPIGVDALTWSAYRLNKTRMRSINKNSTLLRFTCEYDKEPHGIETSDYLQFRLNDLPEVLWNSNVEPNMIIPHDGKIGDVDISNCTFKLSQYWRNQSKTNIYAMFKRESPASPTRDCNFTPSWRGGSNTCQYLSYFGNYRSKCVGTNHRCSNDNESTTQLWFGHYN